MKSIKNKVLFISLFVMIIIIIFGIFRIRVLNLQYPNPQEIYFHINEDCTISESDYLIRLLNIELLNGEEIQDFSSGMPFLYNIDGTPYPWEKQRMILTTIELEGTNDQNTLFDLTEIVLEAKAWSNGMESELFSILNGENSSLYVKLAAGEKQTIICPFLINDTQFTEKDWKNLNVEKFSLVLSYYPKKIMLSK